VFIKLNGIDFNVPNCESLDVDHDDYFMLSLGSGENAILKFTPSNLGEKEFKAKQKALRKYVKENSI